MRSAPLTVIIPTRNAAGTLRRAVLSTLRDLRPDDRIIVTNDGSDDATGEVLNTLPQGRLTVLTNASPIGVGASLNLMLSQVSTPLVARMDADDIVIPGRFERQRQAISNGLDVVFGSIINFGRTPRCFVPATVRTFRPAELALLHTVINPSAHPTMMASTAVLLEAKGYRASPAEDLDLWYRLHADEKQLAVFARPVLFYRLHASQVSGQAGWRLALKRDPALIESHTALLRRHGWEGPSCWSALQQPREPGEDGLLTELKRFLLERSREVGGQTEKFLRKDFRRRNI